MTGMEQPAQVLFMTEIGGSVKHLIGVVNPFRTDTANWTDTNIQPTVVNFNQATGLGNGDWNTSPSGIWIVILMFPDPGVILITVLG